MAAEGYGGAWDGDVGATEEYVEAREWDMGAGGRGRVDRAT